MTALRPILRNAGWNLLGNLLPLIAGLAAVPYLIGHIGTERFGLLSLAWILIGYFGLFDLGLGRALTRAVAQRWTGRSDGEVDSLCSTGLALGCAAGVGGGVLVAALATLGDGWFSHWSPTLLREARSAILIVAAGVVPTVASAVLRGIIEGVQRFKVLTAIRVPAGVLLFAAPCLSAALSPRLDFAVAMIVLTRWLVLGAYGVVCLGSVCLSWSRVDSRWVRPLMHFGGWLTVSNIVGPLIVYLDRFVIGALLAPRLLAYYSAPFEMVSRLLVLPTSLTGALFPALSDVQHRDAARARTLRRQAYALTAVLVLPTAVIGALLAPSLLRLWLGNDFADHGSRAMQVLLFGFAFNAIAQIPMVALYGHGLARHAATLHLIELPLYAGFLYAMVSTHGLVGAALAWAARGALDFVALSLMLHRAESAAALRLNRAQRHG